MKTVKIIALVLLMGLSGATEGQQPSEGKRRKTMTHKERVEALTKPIKPHHGKAESYEVWLGPYKFERSPGSKYFTVVGTIKNLTDKPLRNIYLAVQTRTAEGEAITTDRGEIEYQPLMQGQESKYEVMIRYNPLMAGMVTAVFERPKRLLKTDYRDWKYVKRLK